MAKVNYELEYYKIKLENEQLKNQMNNSGGSTELITRDELIELLNLASNMRDTLIECRGQQIDFKVAKMIDDVLSQARQLD